MRLGTVQHRQDAPIYHIRYSPDGKFVVTDGDDGQFRVWDAGDGRLIRRLDVGIGEILDLAFSSDGKRVAAVGLLSNPVKRTVVGHTTFTDLATGRRVAQGKWEEHDLVMELAFSPDARLLTIGMHEGTVRVLDAMTGVESLRINLAERRVDQIAFASAGNRIAIASIARKSGKRRTQINVFDLGNGKELRVIPELDGEIEALAFSPDGTRIAATLSSHVVLWDIASGQQAELKADLGEKLAFSADGLRLAGFDGSGTFRLWDLVTRRRIDSFKTSTSALNASAFSPDARTFASNGEWSVLHFWDLETHRDRLAFPDAHADLARSILFTADGKTLITGSGDKTVRLWDLGTGRLRKILRHEGGVRAIALSIDGRSLVTGTEGGGFANLWDLTKEEGPINLLVGYRLIFPIFPIALGFSSRADSILGCGNDGTLRRWDLKERRMMTVTQPQFSGTAYPFPGYAFSAGVFFADGQKLAVIDYITGLHVVDLPTGKELYHVADANVVVPSPDERTLAIATPGSTSELEQWVGHYTTTHSDHGTISLLDSVTGVEKLQIAVPGSQVWALAFSPDGKTLAATAGWRQGQIHLYEAATGKETRTIASPPLRTSALAFTPDGASLVTGMADTSVLIWDVRSKE